MHHFCFYRICWRCGSFDQKGRKMLRSWCRHDYDWFWWCLQTRWLFEGRHNCKGHWTSRSWEDHVWSNKSKNFWVVHQALWSEGITFIECFIPLLNWSLRCEWHTSDWWGSDLQVNLFVDHSQVMDLECLRGRNLGKSHRSVLSSSYFLLWVATNCWAKSVPSCSWFVIGVIICVLWKCWKLWVYECERGQ